MKLTRISIYLLSCVLLYSPQVSAQDQTSSPLSLAELRLNALEKSPDAAKITAEHAGIISDGIDIGSPLNPEIEVVSAIPRGASNLDSEITVSLKQPFRLSDFGARSQVQSIMSRVANAEKKQGLLILSQEVTLAYFSLWSFEETKKNLAASLKDVRAASVILSKGLQDGTALPSEKILFDGYSAKIEADIKGIESESLMLRTSLTRLSSTVLDSSEFKEPELPPLPSEEAFMASAAENAIGKMKQSELILSLRNAEARMARLDAAPEFKPKIGYQRSAEGVDYLEIGIEFPLPLWNSNSGAIHRVDAQQKSALTEYEYNLSENFEQTLKDSLKRCRLLEEQRTAYSKKIIPAFREVSALELKRMKSGQGSVLSLWEAGRQLLEARTRWVELTREALTARLTLEVFSGQPYAF